MLLAAIARPEKTAALVGISSAADHIVTSFNSLPLEVGALQTCPVCMSFLAFKSIPTDAQGVWGQGGVDVTLQTRRGGSLQVQHGFPARGRKSLCSPQPNPHYLPRTAYSRAQRRRCSLAHLHASCWADPQPRRGRHPPETRPAPHVREGWHQADGLHHWRPHRQADHHGLSEWWRRGPETLLWLEGRRTAYWESEPQKN